VKRMGLIYVSLLVMLVASGCTLAATPEPTATPTMTPEPTATATEMPMETLEPSTTPTDKPTATVKPSETPIPTHTTVPPTVAPATEAPSAEPTVGQPPTPTPIAANYAPANAQVWQLDTSPSSVTKGDVCTSDFYFDFYGLVAVTPAGDALTWQTPTSAIYTLGLSQPNVYWGSGLSPALPGYTIQVTVIFSGPEAASVTYVAIPDAEPECKHTFVYGAFKAWDA